MMISKNILIRDYLEKNKMKVPEDIKALDEKIAKAKLSKQQQEGEDNKHSDFSHLATGVRLGVELASGTIVGAAIGYTLDEMFDFRYIMLLIFTIFGGCAGMLNAYRYIKSINNTEEKQGRE